MTQSQRCNRKRTHSPLIALFFLVFIVCSILYNELSIQRIHQDSHHDHQEAPVRYIQPNLFDRKSGKRVCLVPWFVLNFKFLFFLLSGLFNFCALFRILEVLDRFSKCNATREYSGWKIGWADPRVKSGRRRVGSERCDVFSGKWVFDNASYPLYNESQCPYMSDQLACHKHGRSDVRYQYWRWQPHNCNLKR